MTWIWQIAIGLLMLLPTACTVLSTNTTADDSLNDDPEVLQIEDLELRVSTANTSHAWYYDQKTRKSFPLDENVNWSIEVRITNSGKRPLTFTGWSFGENSPTARDDSCQRYDP